MISRRTILGAGASVVAMSLAPIRLFAQMMPTGAMQESKLIYLTPIRSDGSESKCQAEVWFVADGSDIYVVTSSTSWRARAIGNGLTAARIWVGDLGQWKSTEGKYRSLPKLETKGSVVVDETRRTRVLELFGSKYSLYWLLWGPRFKSGLKDGSRQMFRYRPQGL
jgi:hypothetical protein